MNIPKELSERILRARRVCIEAEDRKEFVAAHMLAECATTMEEDWKTINDLKKANSDCAGFVMWLQKMHDRMHAERGEAYERRDELATRADSYATEINRLRNVIQSACIGGTTMMLKRWKELFPDASVPTVQHKENNLSDNQKELLNEALQLIRAQQEWIMAVPSGTPLPTMPGLDYMWAREVESKLSSAVPPNAPVSTIPWFDWNTNYAIGSIVKSVSGGKYRSRIEPNIGNKLPPVGAYNEAWENWNG